MNFFTVRLVEEGGELRVHEGDFTISVARQHEPYLRPYLGKEVVFGIRPEDLHHRADAQPDGAIPAKITVVEPLGAEIHLYAETAHHALVARVPPEHRFRTREMLELTPNMENGHYFDPDTEMSLLPVQWEEPA
jgi:multiple sugar transport system ATP-binding protein